MGSGERVSLEAIRQKATVHVQVGDNRHAIRLIDQEGSGCGGEAGDAIRDSSADLKEEIKSLGKGSKGLGALALSLIGYMIMGESLNILGLN